MKPSGSIALPRSATLSEYARLMKPELTFLSVLTAVGSAFLAMRGTFHYQFIIQTFVGTTLVGGAAGVFNQYIERRFDALMKRTERRPLPSGNIQPHNALLFGSALAMSGILYLSLFTNGAAVALALITLGVYLAIYTPLKRRTPFATVVGGIPGAIPPLIGWAVVRGSLSMEAWALFFILFFWQTPHFLSLAWMYRKDYARAGYKTLVVLDETGRITGRQIVISCCALVPASLLPTLIGLSGYLYFAGALFLSCSFLIIGLLFFREQSSRAARRIFFSSLLFITILFLLLILA